MQSIIVSKNHSNVKLEKYLQSIYPNLSYGTLQKAFRKKDIRANGIRVGRDYIVLPGDKLDIFISDDLLTGSVNIMNAESNQNFSVVYEDENILLVNKEQGIPVHPDRGQSQQTLIDLVREYLRTKSEYPATNKQFQPALCHRLDRNTGGLVIIAKNQAALDFLLEKIETREVNKYYQCLVKGRMEKQETQLNAFLWKDTSKSRVFISNSKTPGALAICTNYSVIRYNPVNDVSLLEVELVTGRTHQIRAHLAFTGHPIIGDGKYGTNAVNNSFGLKYQALWAYKIKFSFKNSGSVLEYLSGKEFTVAPGFDTSL